MCKYAPGMSKLAMLRFSYTSITSIVKSDYRDTVGDETLSLFPNYIFCLLPSAHVLTLIVPYLFCLMSFTTFSDYALSSTDNISVSIVVTPFFPGIGPSSNCLSSFIMAATTRYQNKLKARISCICINIIFTADLMDSST